MSTPKYLSETAYSYIKDCILNCVYLPTQDISEKQIAEEINIGRTPVREALLRLQNEGLVDIFPRKKICVSKITEKDIYEVYELRKLIDPVIAVQQKRNINKNKLLDYKKRFDSLLVDNVLSEKEFYSLDMEFHRFIIETSKNSLLLNFYSSLMQKQYRIGVYSIVTQSTNPKEKTIAEHNEIIDSILRENDELIWATITTHINSSFSLALSSFFRSV